MNKKKIKKPRSQKTKQTKRSSSLHLFRPLYLAIICIVIGIAGGIIFLLHLRMQSIGSEMHTLPPEIKKKIALTPTPDTVKVMLPLRLPILMYHYVEIVRDQHDTLRKSLAIPPNIFEEQIKTLLANNYTFLTTAEIPMLLSGKKPMPQHPVILTFDDGYRDFYTDVYPILKKYRVKAVAYIVPGFLDHPNYMFHQQVEEISHDGLVEIAAHTVHHVYLQGMASASAQLEIAESKKMLEQELHKPIVSFAYPYGAFDLQAMRLVEQAGFTNAVSTLPGIAITGNNSYLLYRLRPGMRVGAQLVNYLQGSVFRAF